MKGIIIELPRKVPLNKNERVLESGKLLILMQRESCSCADSSIIKRGIEHVR